MNAGNRTRSQSTADQKTAGDILGDASKHATEPQNTTPTKPLKRRQPQKHFYKNGKRAKETKENAAEIYLKTKKTESGTEATRLHLERDVMKVMVITTSRSLLLEFLRAKTCTKRLKRKRRKRRNTRSRSRRAELTRVGKISNDAKLAAEEKMVMALEKRRRRSRSARERRLGR